jgi:hypothetical protein
MFEISTFAITKLRLNSRKFRLRWSIWTAFIARTSGVGSLRFTRAREISVVAKCCALIRCLCCRCGSSTLLDVSMRLNKWKRRTDQELKRRRGGTSWCLDSNWRKTAVTVVYWHLASNVRPSSSLLCSRHFYCQVEKFLAALTKFVFPAPPIVNCEVVRVKRLESEEA